MTRMPTRPLVAALRAMMAAEGTDRQLDARKAAAAAIVDERQRHQYDGHPDWNGVSGDYRMVIQRAYRDAGVPTDAEDPVLAAGLRFHVRKEVRKRAPAADIPIRPRAPRRMPVDASEPVEGSSMPDSISRALEDPVGLVRFAIRSVEAAVETAPASADAETIRYMLPTLRDAVDKLAALVGDSL